MDHKQIRIIESWVARAQELSTDAYAAFISLWIAFNAFCYARYARQAQKRRADLKKGRGLDQLESDAMAVEGRIRREPTRILLDLDKPGGISINFSERYTEDGFVAKF